MPNYRLQMTIETADNNPENFATNTWHCVADDVAGFADFITAVRLFYTTVDVQMGNLAKATSGLKWKGYDLADPEPRVPIQFGSADLTLGSGGCLPPEVALCLSFQGEPVSGINQARKRGRIYLPFILDSSNTSAARPVSTLITALAGAGEDLLDASAAATDWKWSVYSPTSDAMSTVTNGWVDNEWDIQRRRGRKFTERTTFV